MAYETLQPIFLNDTQKKIEDHLKGYEDDLPEMLIHVVPVGVVLKEMLNGELYEV